MAALLELGVPLRLLAGFDDPHASVPLSVLVRTFDRPRGVRLAPGAVVVVAGPAELAVRTAVAMAHRAGLAAHEVVLAGDVDALPGHGRRVQTTSAAARVRERVPDDAPLIVALGVGGTGSAAELLAAFEPDEAWAALDARLRSVELRRWLRAVGARRAVRRGRGVAHVRGPGARHRPEPRGARGVARRAAGLAGGVGGRAQRAARRRRAVGLNRGRTGTHAT